MAVQSLLKRMGYELHPYRPPDQRELSEEDRRRAKLLNHYGIDLLLDVGANSGQYGSKIRRAGYAGRIVSFEPMADAFSQLSVIAEGDSRWECRRHALGSSDGSAQINVSQNSYSSSILEMGDRHRASAPDSAYVGTEKITLARLDSVWDELVRGGEQVFLKLDVQGFERQALRGAEGSLPSIVGVESELSLVSLYEGAPDYREMIDELGGVGFRLAGLEPEFADPRTGEMLQVNGIFFRD